MYFFKEKRFLVVFLVMVRFIPLFSQESKPVVDTNLVRQDTIAADSTKQNLRLISHSAVDKQVKYNAVGQKRNDLVNKTATLINKAVVTYGDIEIRADSIVFNMATSTVYAAAGKDTTAKGEGKPVFKDGSQEYKCDSLIYDFVTKKAIAYNIVTKQDEGLLRSSVTKLLGDGTSNIGRSTYSTCDAEHPHFYVNLTRAKVYPGKKIVSGPGYLVLEGIPLPLALPFGFFPIQTKKAASGILIPKIGQEQLRGYNLTDGGYYFAISDYFDLALRGSIYTNGTWILTAESNYSRQYKYNGQFSFNYANNISGHKGLSDYSKTTNYKIAWTYNQSAKAHPGSRFAANVNMSSSGYDKTNSYTVSEHVQAQRQSAISYTKSWEGTPFNLSASMNQNQNVTTKKVNVDLPKVNFNMSRIYPLKGKNSVGTKKWYQELQFSYTANLDNKLTDISDSLLFTKNTLSKMQSGFKQEAPLSLQIRPFKNFSISPQVSYIGVLYTQKTERFWNPNYYDEEKNKYTGKQLADTIHGVFYGQALSPSLSASFSPQIFGTYTFGPESRIQAIRHVMKPSVTFSYVPAFSGLSSKMYYRAQTDSLGHTTEYSIFDGSIYGTPSKSSRSGGITFNLTNILEAKVFEKNDTSSKPKKIKLIDNFGISTTYNLFADSMRWSPLVMDLRTTLMDNIGVSVRGNLSLYGIDKNGHQVRTFALTENNKLMRLTNFSVSLDFDLGQLIRGDKKKAGAGSQQQGQQQQQGQIQGQRPNEAQKNTLTDEWGYSIFDVPWSMRVSYIFNYTKPAFKPTFSQTLSVNGNVTLTKKMAITYTSGYDFDNKAITMTQIGITRDLHCWTMSFNWVPNGSLKMWNFVIRVRASVLKDLKYERRKDYHDTYY